MPPFGAPGGGFPMPPAPAGFQSSATVDVPSSPVASSQDDSKKGEKFKKNSSSTVEPAKSSETKPNLDVVVSSWHGDSE